KRECGGVGADAERDDEHRGEHEAWRAPHRADGVAQVLGENVGVDGARAAEDVADRCEPGGNYSLLGNALGEHALELLAVLVAERRGIEPEQRAVEAHQVVSGVRPRARASRTSWVRRRVSARATAVPNG